MVNISDIIKGHVKELLNEGQPLSEKRMAICATCPLYLKGKLGPICNPGLYLNVDTNETSTVAAEGFKKGCGCRLNAKTRIEDAECPLGKW